MTYQIIYKQEYNKTTDVKADSLKLGEGFAIFLKERNKRLEVVTALNLNMILEIQQIEQ